MAYVYLNNDDWIKIYERAKKEGRKQSDILKEELNKAPIEKTTERFFYLNKLKGDKKEKWHEYKRIENGNLELVK